MTHEDLALLDTLRALQGYLLQILIRSFYGCLISNRQTDRQTDGRTRCNTWFGHPRRTAT